MLVTPFDDGGSVDHDNLVDLVAHVLGFGVNGVAALGLAGEAQRLEEVERVAVVETVAAALPAGIPLVVGCTASDTPTAVRLASHAAAHGAAAVMVAPIVLPNDDAIAYAAALAAHYDAIAEAASPAALMVQDAPGLVGGASVPMEVLDRLFQTWDNARYVKSERLPAAAVIAELVECFGVQAGVFGGNGALYFLDSVRAGACGLIPGCELPGIWVALDRLLVAGSDEDAARLFGRVLPFLVFENQSLDLFIACNKELLRLQGVLRSSALRGPRGVADPLGSHGLGVLKRYATACLQLQEEIQMGKTP